MRYYLAIILINSLLLTALGNGKDLFEEDEPLTLTLVLPMDSMRQDRFLEDPAYRPLDMLIHEGGHIDTLTASFRVRGNFRKRPENCEWAPLKIKLKRREASKSCLGVHREFKLVTSCQGENYLIREYMVYKMYHHLTEYSLRVRMVTVILRDALGQEPDVEMKGFIIEDKEGLAMRKGLEIVEGDSISANEVELRHRARLYLFQYMIGNRDWDIYSQKNVVLFRMEGVPLAVPFDFDLSGCVDVPYMDFEGIERRYFRSICWDDPVREEIRQELRALVPVWTETIHECRQLSNSDKKAMLRYFKPFFDSVESDKKWDLSFPSTCT